MLVGAMFFYNFGTLDLMLRPRPISIECNQVSGKRKIKEFPLSI